MGVLIKKESSCLFIRVPDYKNYNSIEEHIKCINKYGYVWLIKLGRKPNYTFMNQFMKDGGNLILKTTPKNGNKYYWFKVDSKVPDSNFIVPKYYDELFENEGYDIELLKTTHLCLKATQYKELTKEEVDFFETISKKKPLSTSILNSRAPQVYGKSIKEIEL